MSDTIQVTPSESAPRFSTVGKSTTHRERYFYFVLDAKRFSHATIFARETEPHSGRYYLGYALCDRRDDFKKTEGRSRARRRLMIGKQKGFDLPIVAAVSHTDLYDAVKIHLVARDLLWNTKSTVPVATTVCDATHVAYSSGLQL